MSPKELAEQITDAINVMGFNEQDFATQMLNQHRTLQQNFSNLCIAWFYKIADTEYFDGRNQASVEVGKKIKQALGDYQPKLPHI